MEESYHHRHHHHHHHHGHNASQPNQGHQLYSQQQASSQGALNSGNAAITEYHQQQQRKEASRTAGEWDGVNQPTITVPIGALNIAENQTFGAGVQPTSSFHSITSLDSTAEMSKYFPETHPSLVSPISGYQQEAEGQVQSTATSNSVLYTNTNAYNAGPYASVPAPFPVQRFPRPIRPTFMAQQRSFRPSQLPPGIPSYSSQIEGLSVSQAVVNDVLVDLQSKVINESLQQYQNESSSGDFLEPLPPIYIRAPQPTIILRSDLNRLRAELRSRVRPQVVFRHPGGVNQFQQHRFQQNTFQVPRFPTPPQQHIPPECYGEYGNPIYANSDIHKTTTTTTTGDEHRKENEDRLYNQAESLVLNDDNVNDNVHSVFDLQGLSTASFDRYASPYQSSFLSNLEDHHQQEQLGNEETVLTTSDNINQEETERTEDMFSRPVRPRPEITFDINNCIFRCFEAHRQRVARRRAARQARRAKRHRQSQHQQQPQQQQQQQHPQYQQVYNTDQYQNLPTQPIYPSEHTQWQHRQPSSSHYLDSVPPGTSTSTSVHTTQRPYIPAESYNYTGVGQTTSLPTDIQQYQSSDIINTGTSHIPFSSLSSSSIGTGVPTDVQSLTNDYYQYNNINAQEPYIHSKPFDYSSHQTVPSTTDLYQQQQQTSYDYSNQIPYSSFSTVDATVPGEIQHLTSKYYQQQIPNQFIQPQSTYVQPSAAFQYTTDTSQSQIPTYSYQSTKQPSSRYPYNIENIQQQPSFNYTTAATTTYTPSDSDTLRSEQKQTFDYSSQPLASSDYYQQQPTSVPVSQIQGAYDQPSGTFGYKGETYQSQQPIYDYQGIEKASSQFPYNLQNIEQQHQSFDYTTGATAGYLPTGIDTYQTKQKQTFDYPSQAVGSSDYYEQQPTSLPVSQGQGPYGQPSGTFEYTRESYQSQKPIYNYQGVDQQSSQYPYNGENITQQHQSFDYTTGATVGYEPSYDYQGIDQQSSQYPYNVGDIQQQQQQQQQGSYNYDSVVPSTYPISQTDTQQTEEKQTFDYSSQPLSSSNYYQQQSTSVPTTQVQESHAQPSGTFEYTRESYESQEPSYDYHGVKGEQQQQQTKQEKMFDHVAESTAADAAPKVDTKQTEEKQTTDYSGQAVSSSDTTQQQPTSIPISQFHDSQVTDQRFTGASIPTGTVEYTRQAYYAQEPLGDNYTTENFIEQREQQKDKETMDVNDYLKKFESESNITSSYPQLTGGQTKSSDDRQSITTSTTTPFTIHQNVDTYPSQGAAQTYDLQNYTNESLILEKTQPSIPSSSSVREEDHQHLLQQTVTSEEIHAPFHQPEQHSEIESSTYDTYSSLPPPPVTKEINQKQESIRTNTSDFPPPPTPDRHTYQTTQQKPSSSFTSIIPTVNQASIYSEGQTQLPPLPDTRSDHETEDDSLEDEEIFDLRRCIARCYAKYQDSWNKEEQEKYAKLLNDIQQPIPDATTKGDQRTRITSIPPCAEYQPSTTLPVPPYDERIGQYQQVYQPSTIPSHDQQFIQQPNALLVTNCDYSEQPQPYLGINEIHFTDKWTQTHTPTLNVTTRPNIVQHTYDQTPTSFETTPCIPQIPTEDLSTDSRGPQTIEYSPPLITQARHVIPTILPPSPLPCYEEGKYQQQQQQQPVYDHVLPVPPHLSFNDSDYQPNLYFSPQTAQPHQYQNIPLDKYEEQQQRLRAHSEPPSIQQDTVETIIPIQPSPLHTFEQQPRRSVSIPMIHHQYQQPQPHMPPIRLLDNGRSYETETLFTRRTPRIDPRTGLCLVPCPETRKYAHLPPHLRPELFCVELPPPSFLPPMPPPLPPPPPPPPVQQQQRWCVRCCCVPGRTTVKKIIYKQVGDEKQQQQEESHLDYSSVMDQMATRITVRYGNRLMEDGETCIPGNYHEQLRVIDFPVYVSGKNDTNLTPLVPVN